MESMVVNARVYFPSRRIAEGLQVGVQLPGFCPGSSPGRPLPSLYSAAPTYIRHACLSVEASTAAVSGGVWGWRSNPVSPLLSLQETHTHSLPALHGLLGRDEGMATLGPGTHVVLGPHKA